MSMSIKFKGIIIGIAVAFLLVAAAIMTVYRNENTIKYSGYDVFMANKKLGISYRIPGIIVTNKGTIVCYCEERLGISDNAFMNIVYKRSEDGGKSWGKTEVLAEGIKNEMCINDPIMLQDTKGRIHCFYTPEVAIPERGGWLAYTYSDDDALTWSDPIDLSEVTNPEDRDLLATGPGHGIELSNGTLLIPLWYTAEDSSKDDLRYPYPAIAATLYSLDYGQSWNLGEPIVGTEEIPNPTECEVVELNDGNVMINIRNESDRFLRAVSVSPNGYSDWGDMWLDESLPDSQNYGSICRYDENTLLFVNSKFDEKNPLSRQRVVLRISSDEGKTWREARIIQRNYGGYSDVFVDNNKMIYVLGEQYVDGYFSIRLLKFNMAWLKH